MDLSRRQKVTVILLVIYWPAFFVLTHIPVPTLVRQAGVSDKGLHFLAYLTLVFLLWFTVNGDKKVNWRKAGVWWILLVVVGYGVVDELLQDVVGRNCDIRDMAANLLGTLTGLSLFSFFTFWPASLLVVGSVIFGITNIARADLAELFPVIYPAFHLFAYAIFTMLWIQYLRLYFSMKPPKPQWLVSAWAGPMVLLLTVKLFSKIIGRVLGLREMFISVVVLTSVVAAIYLMTMSKRTHEAKENT